MAGVVIGLARRAKSHAPMEALESALISRAAGVDGDSRGKAQRRQVTILFAQDWKDATREAGADLPWTARRANVLVTGLANPRRPGGLLQIGAARIRILGETEPCTRMDAALAGLQAALAPDWRGGVLGRVEVDGHVQLGDASLWLE
jgi:MOSC domain-containing protein YiiM